MIGLALAVSFVAAPQILQSANSAEGQRVRLLARSDSTRPVVGFLGGAQEGRFNIRVSNAGTVVSIAPDNVAKLSVSRGVDTGRGIRNGLVAGVIAGAILFVGTVDDASDIEKPLVAVVSFGLVPIPFGVAGYLLAGERWEAMPAPPAAERSAGHTAIRFAPNERVRATTPSGTRSGAVSRSTDDALTLVSGDRIAWRDISTISVMGGRSRLGGGIIGGLAGLLVGAAATAGSPSPDASANAGGILLATVGGAILGSRYLPITKWVALPLPK
jgi:hypothetical protein